ncbi:MAG TPA: hypothetical protein PKC43_06860 [Phycisphaerales bacterium]|nr:hypothetical protein [Phycisphaerales bacterium]HMP37153.1 hypothetical protein [Phycisphaerales bacterium]
MPETITTIAELDAVMEAATEAIVSMRYFEAERSADEALRGARALASAAGFRAMARIMLPLQEARRQRLDLACEATRRDAAAGCRPRPVVADAELDVAPPAGLWIVSPPMVAADARRLRLASLRAQSPAAIVCIEPITRARRCPVVAVGQVVLRAFVDPPADLERPDTPWFIAALEALGESAIAAARSERDPIRRVDALMAALDAHPDHERLHQALADACRDAALSARSRLRR